MNVMRITAAVILTAVLAASAPQAVFAADSAQEQKGWVTEEGRTYYYGKDHQRVSGWKKIRKKWYYFNQKTKALAVNCIAGDKKTGYYYVDGDGVRVSDRTVRKAAALVRACTKTGMSKEEKVEACFRYIAEKCRYQHDGRKPSASQMPAFAYGMYTAKSGNCYMSAAAVAYCAKVIGCPARVTVGGNTKASTGHGWAEVMVNGKWYVYDASRQRWSYGRDLSRISWKKFYTIWKNTRFKVLRNVVFTLEIKDGKAVWKKAAKQ